jgi:hypothetical protein
MLHNTVEGFMTGLKALPKVGPERGKFITSHMNNAQFLGALKAHPQGAQIHQMLTTHLNSKANAGPKNAQMTVAKSEKDDSKDRKVAMPLWKDRPISDPGHEHDLEQRSAMLEFNDKLPKEQAEHKAHQDYKKEQHLKAAARHFAGAKAARAVGDHEESKKHHAMYVLHLKELGLNPNGAVPKEIEHHMLDGKSEPFYRFEPHPADGFLFQKDKKKS